MITLTIDGKKVRAEQGTTLLNAAKAQGIEIPTLCAHEGLSPLGNCRLCVVEVTKGGRTRVVTSCNYLVEEDLLVETNTENILAIRKSLIELLLGRSPHVKIVKELARTMGIDVPRFNLENDKCILCGLCVHVCSEYIGAYAITFCGKGTKRYVAAPLLRSARDCIGCGACVEICPAQCITMEDCPTAMNYFPGGKKEVGPVRIIHNWSARIAWKACTSCGTSFPPPSPMNYLKKGQPLPKNFFDICERCRS